MIGGFSFVFLVGGLASITRMVADPVCPAVSVQLSPSWSSTLVVVSSVASPVVVGLTGVSLVISCGPSGVEL